MEAWGGALLRAMAGDASLQWSGQTLYRGTAPVVLAAAHQSDVPARLADQRGLLDGASLRLRLSDAALHARHLPGEPVERLVFELLEQLRVESLAPEEWPGARANLHARFVHWSQAFADSGLTESSLGILLFTVALTAWSRLSGHEPPDALADLAEATRAGLSAQVARSGPCCAATGRTSRPSLRRPWPSAAGWARPCGQPRKRRRAALAGRAGGAASRCRCTLNRKAWMRRPWRSAATAAPGPARPTATACSRAPMTARRRRPS